MALLPAGSTSAGRLVIEGNGCRIQPMEDEGGGLTTRLLNIEAAEGSSLSFQLFNLTISNFGATTITGGAMRLQNLAYGSIMRDVMFFNNTGE